MSGGVSHVDSFDPKPKLFADHGKTVTIDHPETRNRPGYEKLYLKRPQWEFQPRGESGTEVSTLFPHIAECVDDIAVIRSLYSDHSNHYNATLGMHTGSFNFARPSIGAWTSYGLGSPNRNLPSFVVIAPHTPYAGGQVWAADFLPGSHQGTLVVPGPEPMRNVRPKVSVALQRRELDALAELNKSHLERHANDPALAARIRTFETAFGMQTEAPEAFDLSGESDETLRLYGLPRGGTQGFAWQCLVARRLAERGVRFIELIDSGSSNNWDAHGDMIAQHAPLAKNVDRPIAGLLKDLLGRRGSCFRRYAGGLDDGVRPHALQQHRRCQGTRASQLGLQFLARRRRGEGRDRVRSHRRIRHQGRGESRPRPRLSRHDPAPARARSSEAHLPPRRPRLPPDRRAWTGRA